MDIYSSDQEQKTANRTGLLLAHTRYLEQIAPFVKASTDRLAFARPEIERIVKECSEEVSAEAEYVGRHLRQIIADDIATHKPERITLQFKRDERPGDLGYGGGPPSPPLRYDPAKVNPEPDAVSDTSYHQGPVLEDEIREPDETLNLKQQISKANCGCEDCDGDCEDCDCDSCDCKQSSLNSLSDEQLEMVAKVIDQREMSVKEILATYGKKDPCVRCGAVKDKDAIVCGPCQESLLHKAAPFMQPMLPVNGQPGDVNGQPGGAMPGTCAHCGGVVGPDGVCPGCGFQAQQSPTQMQHGEMAHPDEVNNMRNQFGQQPSYFGSTEKEALGDHLDYDPNPRPAAPMQGPQPMDSTQPNANQPAEFEQFQSPRSHFDDVITTLANAAAARQFSAASEDDISQVAQQLGINPDDVAKNLKMVAQFGEVTAVNGDLQGDDDISEYEEVPGMGGPVEAHEAVVPLQIAVAKVSQDMGLDEAMVMNNLKDSFGNQDLPNEYHSPIQGGQRYYLPKSMLGAQQPLTREPEPQIGDQSGRPDLSSEFE